MSKYLQRFSTVAGGRFPPSADADGGRLPHCLHRLQTVENAGPLSKEFFNQHRC
jgi:hypothetical protein